LHVLRESPGSFIEDSLFSPSNFRAIVIHGTNSSRISRNVGYDIQGMALYLEDGVEENNVIEHNLIAYVSPIKRPADGGYGQGGEVILAAADLLNPADTSASPFYISNAYNDFIGNQASGGWAGFAFPNLPRPIGVFRTVDNGRGNPLHRPIKTFVGNSAHSSGFYWKGHGSCIYTGAWIDYDGSNNLRYHSGRRDRQTFDMSGVEQWMKIEDVKLWACGTKGVAHWGNQIEVVGYESYDNKNAAMLFGETNIRHAYIRTRSTNPIPWSQYWGSAIGFQVFLLFFFFYFLPVSRAQVFPLNSSGMTLGSK
jgi:hypothetical protein